MVYTQGVNTQASSCVKIRRYFTISRRLMQRILIIILYYSYFNILTQQHTLTL